MFTGKTSGLWSSLSSAKDALAGKLTQAEGMLLLLNLQAATTDLDGKLM